eukprot:6489270-Amphidinium_carterae.1
MFFERMVSVPHSLRACTTTLPRGAVLSSKPPVMLGRALQLSIVLVLISKALLTHSHVVTSANRASDLHTSYCVLHTDVLFAELWRLLVTEE